MPKGEKKEQTRNAIILKEERYRNGVGFFPLLWLFVIYTKLRELYLYKYFLKVGLAELI